ncbi:glycosyltransferase family 1 protein [Paenibacillus psychroresistens]|uniref:Glycosyltransferase family 1 protein n=1 Tax=Paenibacillus psychroresistens TaxID=1778678 RepID=A0A6B8RNE2_9BACL|nr:glycosyltransferase family 4 protein [Paenibacillus psychroresistens]QGQ97222.1 glycosyltransferase family 1 protein [Paenibacillus psychroresistens]
MSHNSLNILTTGLSWPSLQAGGLNTYFSSISKKLAERNQVQALICSATKPDVPNSKLVILNIGNNEMALQKRKQVFQEHADQIMNQQKIDILFTHFAPYGVGPAQEAKSRGIPVVMVFHGPWSEEIKLEGQGLRHKLKTLIARNIEQKAYRLADHFVVLSEAFRDILHQKYGVPMSKISIIPGAADTQRFQPFEVFKDRVALKRSLDIPEDHTIVLTVRRLVNRMGLLQLLDAWKEVIQIHPKSILLIGGRGPLLDELNERIKLHGLVDKVKLLGFIADGDLPKYYQAADLFVVPTQNLEGFGLITVEAMASGLPVMATPVGGNREILQAFRPKMLFDSPRSEDMAKGLIRLMGQKEQWPTAEECRSHVMEKYTWEQVVKQVEAVLQQAVMNKEVRP